MATDAYIKFGDSGELSPTSSPLPLIEGDSTDEKHYWWCELRESDFEVNVPDRGTDEESKGEDKEANPELPKVTVKKRVDWASTELFMTCCRGHEATVTKSADDEDDDGRIDEVTVEICKTVGERKFPFITVIYYGVRIVSYAIELSGPEPSETITFEIEGLDFQYQPTDPLTGLPKGAVLKATNLKNHSKVKPPPGQVAATSGAAASPLSFAAAGLASAAGGGAGASAAGGNGSAASPAAPTTETVVKTSYRADWGGTGFGVLPD